MKNSPRTTICGLLIAVVILVVFVNWNIFGAVGYTADDAWHVFQEFAKIVIAILVALLGFFAMDEGTH
jgi:hypothetical protein